eukprot:scaffold130838_cov36-Phaeocystis_antarctica.AAC.1
MALRAASMSVCVAGLNHVAHKIRVRHWASSLPHALRMEVRLAVWPHDGRVRDAVWEMREKTLQVGVHHEALLVLARRLLDPAGLRSPARNAPAGQIFGTGDRRPRAVPIRKRCRGWIRTRGSIRYDIGARASGAAAASSPHREARGGPSSEGPTECKQTLRACSAEARQATLSCSCCEPPPNWRTASPWPRRATESAEARAFACAAFGNQVLREWRCRCVASPAPSRARRPRAFHSTPFSRSTLKAAGPGALGRTM